jgi:hypothetical protein
VVTVKLLEVLGGVDLISTALEQMQQGRTQMMNWKCLFAGIVVVPLVIGKDFLRWLLRER